MFQFLGNAGAASGTNGVDDTVVPSRPGGHRPEPQQQTAGNGINNINSQLSAQFGGMSFTAGFGFFPSLFGLQFQSFAPPIPPPPTDGSRPLTDEELEQQYLTKVLYVLFGCVVLGLLLF